MTDRTPTLAIPAETALLILLSAREFHALMESGDPDDDEIPVESGADPLEFHPSEAARARLVSALRNLDEDERLDVLELIGLGRGDIRLSDWRDAREPARTISLAEFRSYLLDQPAACTYFERGLKAFGIELPTYLDGGLESVHARPVARD